MIGRVLRPSVGALALATVIGVLAAGFAAPWVLRPVNNEATGLARYVPLPHGFAWLERSGDEPALWLSGSVRRVPLVVANDEWSPAASRSLRLLVGKGDGVTDDELAARSGDVAAIEIRRTFADAFGRGGLQAVSYVVRDSRGDHLIAYRATPDTAEEVYFPALLQYPARLFVGRSWPVAVATEARAHETTRATVTDQAERSTALGRLEDCLRIEYATVVSRPGERRAPERTRRAEWAEWVCAGVGTVSATGSPSSRVVSTSTLPGRRAELMPHFPEHFAAPAIPAATDLAGSDRWRAQEWADAGSFILSEATFIPVYVEAPIPVVLAASHDDDLRAFLDAGPKLNGWWRFSTAGPVYGRPVVDTRAGRIYFGAADKRLYALTVGGLFLWSYSTDDNVAARPLVAGNVVVVAGEDGDVHALDATTGHPRWSRSTGAPLVSSPARAGDVVVVATETGRVIGLHLRTGRILWDADAAGTVSAAVVTDGARFYVVTESGTATAFTLAGAVKWQTEDLGGLSSDPLLADGQLLMVDDTGNLAALGTIGTSQGDVQAVPWAEGGALIGPPVATPRQVFVLDADGVAYELDRATGAVTRTWPAPAPTLDVDAPAGAARLGLEAGHGLWWADWRSILHHIGGETDDR